MDALLTNWKTSATGAIVIVLGALELAGVHIPGFSFDPGAAFAAGLGLLLAGDGTSKVPIRDVPKPEPRH
jgi:hypothetical protein